MQDTAILEQALSSGAVVLVPNYRSSDLLLDSVTAHRRHSGAPAVQPRPAIFAIDLWLNDVWEIFSLNIPAEKLGWRLLTTAEENLLWRQLIRQSPTDLVLLQEEGTAIALGKAQLLLQQWQIPFSVLKQCVRTGPVDAESDDYQLALHWLTAFHLYCERHHLLTFSNLVQVLQDLLKADSSLIRLLPSSIVLWEFDQPPPLYQGLFDCLRTQGCQLSQLSPTPYAPEIKLRKYARDSDECQAAAAWAADLNRKQPDARIAIICPDGNLLKSTLPRAIHHHFGARVTMVGTSAVTNLGELSWFRTALAVLSLSSPEVSTLDLCALIRSPWLAGASEELDARAALEHRLRSRQELSVLTVNLRKLCKQQEKPWFCPGLGQLLEESTQTTAGYQKRQSMAHWFSVFEQRWSRWMPRQGLLATGDSHLVQAVDSLNMTLQTGFVTGENLDWNTAVFQLRGLIRATTVQESKRQTAVMLLSPVAAAGLHFNHTWNLGMNDKYWPARQSPSAFLPMALQRDYQMSGTDANLALADAQRLLTQLISHTSTTMVMSFASQNADEQLRASPMLPGGIPVESIEITASAGLPPQTTSQVGLSLEVVQDTRLLPSHQIQGTSRYIELQAICPFRAFAEEGLHVKSLAAPVYGLPRSALGTLIHDVLQAIWTEIGSLAALRSYSLSALESLVTSTVQQGLDKLRHQYPCTLTPALRQLEQERLQSLLQDWFVLELQRDDFEIYGTEVPVTWRAGNLNLKLRIDRVDSENGKLLVIDYKSGKAPAEPWGTTAPRQFQLLLYLFALEQELGAGGLQQEVAGILFASLDPATMKYSGITADNSAGRSLDLGLSNARLKVAESDWSALKNRWQEELGSLAREILDGYAAVQPRQKSASCQYCELPAMCRKNELGVG